MSTNYDVHYVIFSILLSHPPSASCFRTPSIYVLPLVRVSEFHTHTRQQVTLFSMFWSFTYREEGIHKTLNWMVTSIPQIYVSLSSRCVVVVMW